MQDDTPRVPPGWEAVPDTLIRLAAEDDRALAWVAPGYGANCIAFMVRADDRWVEILHHAGPQSLAQRPSRFGCAVLFPFPGHMMDFRYRWGGETLAIPRHGSTAPSFTHGFAHTRAWRVVDAAPDRVTATLSTPDCLTPDERAGYPFAIRLTETVALGGGTLRISLRAVNEGAHAAPVGIALHPYFAVAALGGDRARVRVELPGRLEHLLARSVPTGGKRPAAPVVFAPPMGETATVARTGLDEPARAILDGAGGGHTVAFAFIEGVRDVVCFVPPDQPSISIEPHSCAPGAASRPAGDADGLVPLAPGASLAMVVEIAARARNATAAGQGACEE